MNYYISTFGCQANERDSEIIAGILREKGYTPAVDQASADVIIYNTCCVREKAEHKVFSQIGALKDLKSRKPDLIIGICGCMVQQDEMPARIRQRLPHVDLIFGTHNKHELPELLDEVRSKKTKRVSIKPEMEVVVEDLPSQREFSYKGLVHITYGCNNFCTYCIVPYVRGREKSRNSDNIIKEIENMVAFGMTEVMLLGQNVNSYGKDLTPIVTFADLLLEINKIKGLRRIRYMTSHPRDFTDRLLFVISSAEKVCRHFHLPVQSGSNNILKMMNRGYAREDYLLLVKKIRENFPEASITTDIIVGFPGESDEDFQATMELVEMARFDSAFTFIYSPRSGTPAALMTGQVDLKVKKERLSRLMKLQNKISMEINQKLKGKTVEVLVEGCSKTSQEMLTGRTETNKPVLFKGPAELTGQFVMVLITSPQTWVLKGEMS
ncbi:MAG: tRNA (N6-isopentenyl adenosine(37)-C2)-methylthiotransferase MiaB [Firmicutes bacterium HGW-Firmicutes-12]|nr:MAG: tRNA (N6-isopentenyl adenosine(37)-C2)-methylthiotransferase MiaB [Firmicutes bacterium HGW-Firmicutes-12]